MARRQRGSQQVGGEEHPVDAQSRRRPEDGPDVGGVHHPLQHGDAPGPGTDLLHGGQGGAAHGAQHPAGQGKTGELAQQVPAAGVDGGVGAAGQQGRGIPRDVAGLHQEGERDIPRIQRRGDDLGALGNEDALLRLGPAAQLSVGEPGIDVQLGGGQIGQLDDL